MLAIKPPVSGKCRMMSSSITRSAFYLILYAFFLISPTAVFAQAMGPLTRSASNPNYFARPDGTPVYFVGSHYWSNLQDAGTTFPPPLFNNTRYINWMQSNKYNFMRLWAWEHPYGASWRTGAWHFNPLPYMRTGPGLAADGKPKFDVTKLNQAYFNRLRQRVIAAQQKGIYVAIMLFEGWSLNPKIAGGNNPWKYHPFHKDNNINGINGDPSNTGVGNTIQTTSAPATVPEAQRAYVRKVIDTLNDLDNVLYEISNESHTSSVQWQYNMINYIKSYQAGKPKQHPVGMTIPFHDTSNASVFNSPADWVSPGGLGGYKDTPPANNGSKVIITDTDHIWGGGGNIQWVWKSFTRGLNPIFMDNLLLTNINAAKYFPNAVTSYVMPVRTGMTQTANYAARMDLRTAKPNGSLTSTGYMLANPGTQYLVLSPNGGSFTVNLSAGAGSSFSVEWFNVSTGATTAGASVAGGSSAQSFTPPFGGSAVLFLNKVSSLKGPSRVRDKDAGGDVTTQ